MLRVFKKSMAAASIAGLIATLSAISAVNEAPAYAEESFECATDDVYALANLQPQDADRPYDRDAQLLKINVLADDPDERIVPITDIIQGDGHGGGDASQAFDGLGVSDSCVFYFIDNPNATTRTPVVDVYRYDPAVDSAPVKVVNDFSMNSFTAGFINSGAVAPNGDFYFAYFSRQTPSDPSDATTQAARMHLYRYVHPADGEGRSSRTGEVAHFDIAVPESSFSGLLASELHGDIAFDAEGNMIVLMSNEEGERGVSSEQLVIVISDNLFETIPGTWKPRATDPVIPVPRVELDPLQLGQDNNGPIFMGVAFKSDGTLASVTTVAEKDSFGNDVYRNKYFLRNPVTFVPYGGEQTLETLFDNTKHANSLIFDLASLSKPATVTAVANVGGYAQTDDIFEVKVTHQSDGLTSSAQAFEGVLHAATAPILGVVGTSYTFELNVSGNADDYSTQWQCSSGGEIFQSGTGDKFTLDVNAPQAVTCEFDSQLKQPVTMRLNANPESGSSVKKGDTIVYTATFENRSAVRSIENDAQLNLAKLSGAVQIDLDSLYLAGGPIVDTSSTKNIWRILGEISPLGEAVVQFDGSVTLNPESAQEVSLVLADFEADASNCIDANVCVTHTVIPSGIAGGEGDGTKDNGHGELAEVGNKQAFSSLLLGALLLLTGIGFIAHRTARTKSQMM